MSYYSPWLEDRLKYPYRKNPNSLRMRYKRFLLWFVKSHWLILVWILISYIAVSLESYLQGNWYVWIFQNPFSEDPIINTGFHFFVMAMVWLSVIPIMLLLSSMYYAIPDQAEEMLASPTDTNEVGKWIRRSYSLIPILLTAIFFNYCFESGGYVNHAISVSIRYVLFIVLFLSIIWYPIYERFFHKNQ